jgi:hypothetical protein
MFAKSQRRREASELCRELCVISTQSANLCSLDAHYELAVRTVRDRIFGNRRYENCY